jgi:hypothetical protein
MATAKQARIIGKGDLGGYSVQVYQACTVMHCSECQEPIQPGQLFIRLGMEGGGAQRFPCCQTCEPFRPPMRHTGGE